MSAIIITCVNYDDLLALTLPTVLREMSHRPWVLTSVADRATQSMVAKAGCAYLYTNEFYRDGAAFNKAAALNWAVDAGVIDLSGWVMVLDADIALPRGMGGVIENELEDGYLHGAHRLECPDLRAWERGDRLEPLKSPLQMPGFFHMFWGPGAERPWYDDSYEHAGAYDTVFQNRWPRERRKRFSLPVVHLGPLGQNWFGRRTERWSGVSMGAPDAEQVEAEFARHQRMRQYGVSGLSRKEAKIRRPHEQRVDGQ